MYRFDKDLPPLKALRTFEVAARLGSFRLAAKELGVTESAVSRQISLLEEHLGVSLFEREGRGVKPNSRALALQNAVAQGFDLIAAAARDLRPSTRAGYLTVAATTTFCSLWLMPRLTRWNARNPEVSIHMLSDEASPSIHGEQDVSIVLGYESTMGFDAEMLFCEEVFPVCSPDYLDRHPEITDIHQLITHPLIDLHPSHWKNKIWSPMSWEYWLAENAIAHKETLKPTLYTHFPMVLKAARNGMGVGLAWQHLVQDDLEAGRLVRPTDMKLIAKDRCTYLVTRKSAQDIPDLRAFCDWITQETHSLRNPAARG
ncbi:MAG: LysR substrate-binding domain-containing protein [Rhodobacteraceae bacterium]|nr:LysR substrate-binding domain-containing protein [Paracoccaceae bacterium]